LVTPRAGRNKAEQFQHLLDGNLGAQRMKINTRHSHLLQNREEEPVRSEVLTDCSSWRTCLEPLEKVHPVGFPKKMGLRELIYGATTGCN
jgi:hypothetical protein